MGGVEDRTQNHGHPVCRARGATCPPPRFCEANVKSLILTIGAPPDLYCALPVLLICPLSFHSHRAPMPGIFSSASSASLPLHYQTPADRSVIGYAYESRQYFYLIKNLL